MGDLLICIYCINFFYQNYNEEITAKFKLPRCASSRGRPLLCLQCPTKSNLFNLSLLSAQTVVTVTTAVAAAVASLSPTKLSRYIQLTN